jgi:hypothetical protein
MKRLSFGKFSLTILLATILNIVTSFGQNEISGKYIRGDYPVGYVILNPDKSFKFKFNFDLQWDLACGQYKVKGDTIFFTYNKDMFDSDCNNERVNVTDTSGVISQDAIDKRFRPITALLLKNKIQTIKTGDIQEPETVEILTFIYRRKKKRGSGTRANNVFMPLCYRSDVYYF